jgi:hypothetical protein
MAAEQEMTIGYEEVIATLENLDVKELAAILDRGSTLLKKAIGKGPSKKKGTGVVPPQLEQNHEWVKYVLGDAKMNGWESFEMRSTKVDKSSGEKNVEVVIMTGSVEKDGVHVFEDTGKEFTQKDAMSYAKCLKDRNDEVYQAFMQDYSPHLVSKKEATEKVVKKTSEELEREKEEKKAEKEREKEEKKAEKEREKAEKKAEKEREKEEKEREKAREKEEKEAAKKPQKKLLVPVKRDRSASPAPVPTADAALTPQKKIVVKKPAAPVKAARPAVDPFVAGEEGDVKRWEWNKKEYVRDGENYIWLYDTEKEDIGAFQGRYNYEKDVIEECEDPTCDETCEEIDLGL